MSIKYNLDILKVITIEEKDFLIVNGWVYNLENVNGRLFITLNSKKISQSVNRVKREDIDKKLHLDPSSLELGFNIAIEIERGLEINSFSISMVNNDKEETFVNLSKKQVSEYISKDKILHFIDEKTCVNNLVTINGWAITESFNKVNYRVVNQKNEEMEITIAYSFRNDVLKNLLNNEIVDKMDNKIGFNIQFNIENPKDRYFIEFTTDTGLCMKKAIRINGFDWRYALSNATPKNLAKAIVFLSKYGLKETKDRIMKKKERDAFSYEDFYRYHQCSTIELEEQRKHKFAYEPKISIIVPAYKTPKDFLNQMIDSVENQTYKNYELCIADGSVDSSEVEEVLKARQATNDKIKYVILDQNYGISGNTNAALELATGDYIALLDHDDILALSALYEVVEAINEDKDNEVIYTDEDKVDMDSQHHFEPHFKPDFNLDLLRSNNYICHFFVVKKSIIDEVGGFRKEYDGSQDYDLILRCTEKAKKIKHLPRMLYHWRTHMNSTAANPESKMYCFEAGKNAIQDSLKRCGVEGEVSFTDHLGFYRVKYKVLGNPKVSIIIPNKDHVDVLKTCVNSILKKSSYTNYEIIIVENNSENNETFEYYKEIEKDSRVKVVKWESEFNYSAINNFGIKNASSDYYILLNNDTEVITEDWIEEMLANCQRKEVGICGAKLYYPDNTIQHAGVIVGLGGLAGHIFMNFPRDAIGYFAKCKLQQNLSAVTAACLMVKKEAFDKVNGLEEDLKVAFNDIDFCLKVREAGYLVVFNPNVELYHYESKSRGKDDTVEKRKRFDSEVAYMQNKWKNILENGDPYFNKNLDLRKFDYSFKNNSTKE